VLRENGTTELTRRVPRALSAALDESASAVGVPGRSLAVPARWQASRRWRSLDRSRRVTLGGLALLIAAAIVVRVWLMIGYGPAFLGFPDSLSYVAGSGSAHAVFDVPQKPAGYSIFLALVRALVGHDLALTILLQHALGVATGLLLYNAARRSGAPCCLGLVPAAVVFLGGTGLFLEHSLLGDPLFAFAQAVGLYATVRALGAPALRWPLLAGVAIGASFWIKAVGLTSAVLVPPLLLIAAQGDRRCRLRSAGVAAAAALVILLCYLPIQALVTGRWGYVTHNGWNLYGRVATFVDCSKFTPPRGTRFLCPSEQTGRRQSQAFFEYGRSSPAVRRFGEPDHSSADANALLNRFSLVAIEHEPLAYAGAVLHGLTFYVSARAGENYTPQSLREELLNPRGVKHIQPTLSRYYPHQHGFIGGASAAHALARYEAPTRVQGRVLILFLAAAIAGAPLLRGTARWSAVLFALTAIASATFAVAGNGYDARYAYPAFGPIAAAAALGAWGIAVRLGAQARRRERVSE
jgi:dolichyl-phosphate-mannose-protein mannosyltransferase